MSNAHSIVRVIYPTHVLFRNGNKMYNVGDKQLPVQRFSLKPELVGGMLLSSTTQRQRSKQDLLVRICAELLEYSESRNIIFWRKKPGKALGRHGSRVAPDEHAHREGGLVARGFGGDRGRAGFRGRRD